MPVSEPHIGRCSPCWRLILIFSLLVCGLSAHGQTTEAEIKARLLDKPLYLRGCWRPDDLRFDSTGKPLTSYASVTFTLSGIRVTRVRLHGHVLKLEGDRVGLEFNEKGKMSRVPIETHGSPLTIRLEIEAPPDMNFAPTLDAVFASDLAQVPDATLSYWQNFAAGRWLPPMPARKPETSKTRAPSVNPPRLLRSVDPSFSAVARGMHYSGTVIISMTVEPDGSISHRQLAQAAGLGLDESALAAVDQYRFMPATIDGAPVPVDISVVVNFDLF